MNYERPYYEDINYHPLIQNSKYYNAKQERRERMEEKKQVKFSGLLAEMAKYGHNNKTLAKLLDLSEASISKRFSGEVDWSIKDIEILCNYYEKGFNELFS